MSTMTTHEAATLLGISDEEVLQAIVSGCINANEDGYVTNDRQFHWHKTYLDSELGHEP